MNHRPPGMGRTQRLQEPDRRSRPGRRSGNPERRGVLGRPDGNDYRHVRLGRGFRLRRFRPRKPSRVRGSEENLATLSFPSENRPRTGTFGPRFRRSGENRRETPLPLALDRKARMDRIGPLTRAFPIPHQKRTHVRKRQEDPRMTLRRRRQRRFGVPTQGGGVRRARGIHGQLPKRRRQLHH